MNDWVEKFFKCNVGFDLNRIDGKGVSYPSPLQALLASFVALSRTEVAFCALPMVFGADKQVQMLIGATTPEQAAELRSIAESYIGSAYALVGKEVVTRPPDQPSAVMLEHLNGGIVRVRIPRAHEDSRKYQERAYQAMGIVLEMLEQYRRRPSMLRETRRPTGRILRDLFVALRGQDSGVVYLCFDELKGLQALSARNSIYLELQIKAGLGEWSGVLRHPHLRDIVSTRLPRRVAIALLRAMEQSLPVTNVSKENVEALRSVVLPIAEFFERQPDIQKEEAHVELWRTWVTGAALVGNQEGVFKIAQEFGGRWLESLCDVFDWPLPPYSQGGNGESSLQILLALPESDELAADLLKQVFQCGDDEYREIMEKLAGFSEDTVSRLRKNAPLRRIWDVTVGNRDSHDLVTGWAQWFDRLEACSDADSLLQAAIDGAAYWDKTSWDERSLVRLSRNSSTQTLQALRNVLPILLDWLEGHDLTLSRKCSELLLEGLALDDIASIPDLSLARDLLEIVLEKPHDRATYTAMLDAIGIIWDKTKSVNAVPGMFDIFDLLLDAPCSDENSRLQIWERLQRMLHTSWRRVRPEFQALAKSFSQELIGSSNQFEGLETGTFIDDELDSIDLTGKQVAIYTLMEKAAKRARGALERLFPGVNVELNHDHTATSALVSLSQSADYFVFASRSAAHQAFYPITKRRSDIIYPKGKGTASIVRAFCEALESV